MSREHPRGIRPMDVASQLRQRINDLRGQGHSDDDVQFDEHGRSSDPIPRSVKLTAGWAVRLIAIGFAIYLLLWLLDVLAVVVVPVVISLLVAALLTPLSRWLRKIGLPNVVATIVSFFAGLVFTFGLLALIVREFISNYNTIYETVREGLNRGAEWLSKGPLKINQSELQQGIDDALSKLKRDPSDVLTTSLTVISTTGGIISAVLLSMFIIFFFLSDGGAIWTWLCKLFPRNSRWKVNRAGRRSWEVLVTYMNVTLIVALIVGFATWIACLILQVPLALSAGLIAFLFAFIPTLGGLISSLVVIALALISTDMTTAIIMAVVMIFIQTVQGNFIYPILMNRQLKVHPLASLLLVVLGAVVGGIFGALIAVPLAAVINTGLLDLFRANRGLPESPEASELGPDTDDDDLLDPTLTDPTFTDPTDRTKAADETRMDPFGPEARASKTGEVLEESSVSAKEVDEVEEIVDDEPGATAHRREDGDR